MTLKYYDQPCNCGSGLMRYPLLDGAGIFCTYVCDKCERKTMLKYNPAIWDNPHYCASGEEEDLEIDYGDGE